MNETGSEKMFQKGGATRLLIGVLVSAAMAALSWTTFYEDQEARIYDTRFQLRNTLFGAPEQLPEVAILDIDDLAFQTYGFPFTRDRHAVLMDILRRYGARMIGFDMFFYEPSPTLLSPEEVEGLPQETFSREEVVGLIKDHDQEFQRAARDAGNVYLAQTFEISEKGMEFARRNLRDRSPKQEAALGALADFSVPLPPEAARGFYHTIDMEVPLLGFIESARGVGFAQPKPDHDGVVRRYRLAMAYDGRLYFALGFLMACDRLQVPLRNVRFAAGEYIELPDAHLPDGSSTDIRIPVTEKGEMLVNWAGPNHTTFRHLPYNLILDFAETESENRALKTAKRVVQRYPESQMDDSLFLEKAREEGAGDLHPEVLMNKLVKVSFGLGFEEALSQNADLTIESAAADLGVPEEEMAQFVDLLGGPFKEIQYNLQILRILEEDPEAPAEEIGRRMGVSRLEEIKYGVGVLRDLVRRGGVKPEDHPLFFQDLITSAGLQGEGISDRIVTREDFENTVFFYGLTATGTHDLNPTPFGAREAMVGVHATVFNTILTRNFLQRLPKWANAAIMVAFGILMGLLVPRFRAVPGAGLVLLFLAVYIAAAFLVFARGGIWIDGLGPVSTLIMGYLSITLYNYVQKEKEKEFVQGAFGHYLDPKVIDQLVENPQQLGQLGGDMRVMTAFFSDVASFSGISENLTPVELVELLNEYLTEMCDIIAQHGGTIDKFEGDAIIAFYGAPLVIDDHADRAVLAAVDMQDKIAELRRDWEEKGKMVELRKMWEEEGRGEFFRVRMGINTGEMVVGNMGSHTRVDYTIMGDAVNLASRLEGAGKNYGVSTMISEQTYLVVRTLIDVRELDSIRVVGREEPVRVYEILGKKGEVDPQKAEVADFYAQGLAMYRERRWDDAIDFFEEGLKVDAEDGPCSIFIERCRDYKQAPPPETWDAVHVLESK